MIKYSFCITFLVCVVVTAVLFTVAVWDDAAALVSIAKIKPVIDRACEVGAFLAVNMHEWLLVTLSVIPVVLVLIFYRAECRSKFVLCCGVSLAVAAQVILVDQALWTTIATYVDIWQPVYVAIAVGGALYLGAVLLLFLGASRNCDAPLLDSSRHSACAMSLKDMIALLLIVCSALILRIYALNHITNYFEGELSPYSAGATSLRGMWWANYGYYGPWAPLGILYYLPIYLTTSVYGTTLLALRLSSALVGVLTIFPMYLLGRKLAGHFGGHLAAALFAVNTLHIGWSRTDIHPHGVTTWPGVLMCLFLILASNTRKLSWALATALMMGLSWHQYPSGQSAVLIPLGAITLFLFLNHFRLPITKLQLVFILGGVALWFLGLPLSYYPVLGSLHVGNPFNLTGPRALWGSPEVSSMSSFETLQFVLGKAWDNFTAIWEGLFFRVRYLFHQEWLPYRQGFYSRSVPLLEMPFAVIGFTVLLVRRRRFESLVVLSWLIAAVLPGVLSERAYPKRLSTLFPAIDLLAAIAISAIASLAGVPRQKWKRYLVYCAVTPAFVGAFCFQAFFWFSGNFWKYGEPVEVQTAKRVEKLITPGSIVILIMEDGYGSNKYTFLLLDHLTSKLSRPNLLYLAGIPRAMQVIEKPTEVAPLITSQWPYYWTKLRDQLDETQTTSDWQRVVFVLAEPPKNVGNTPAWIEAISKNCAKLSSQVVTPPLADQPGNPVIVTVVLCDLSSAAAK